MSDIFYDKDPLGKLYNDGIQPENELVEVGPQSPGRRETLKFLFKGTAALAGISFMGTSGCKVAEIDEITNQPATESEGLQIMKHVADSVIGDKGFSYTVAENENLANNTGGGKFDLAVFVDVNGNGKIDKRLGMNYITGTEEMVNISDTNTYKFKQISQSSQTTRDYLTTQFTNWMIGIDYSSI